MSRARENDRERDFLRDRQTHCKIEGADRQEREKEIERERFVLRDRQTYWKIDGALVTMEIENSF